MSAAAASYMTRWKRSTFKCPACDRLLWTLPISDGKLWWCGWGPCPSSTTNNGSPSYEELVKKWEQEPEYKETGDWP